jgi:hypothetical protein
VASPAAENCGTDPPPHGSARPHACGHGADPGPADLLLPPLKKASASRPTTRAAASIRGFRGGASEMPRQKTRDTGVGSDSLSQRHG